MQSMFNADAYNSTVKRINSLETSSVAKWGKMNVAQMLAHCRAVVKVALSENHCQECL